MAQTFADLELDDDLCHAVANMGFRQPTSIQTLVIPEALEGRDILASAPTGTGKTLAYLLPLCQFLLDTPKNRDSQCRSLILVPTRELAVQVYEQCEKVVANSQLSCGVITGGINYGTDKQVIDARPDILVATPGRLFEHIEKESLDCRDIESLVLDEADRMLDMGFSTIVNQIASEARWRKQSMLFSATLESKGVRTFAEQLLNEAKEVNASPSRKEKAKTMQWYYLCDDLNHKDAILRHLLSTTVESCIVFVKTRERLHALRDKLWAEFPLIWLQGEMPQAKRLSAINKFKSGEVKLLLATDVAARGIDVQDVSHVINYDMPRGADVYVHRIGRTGRAGAKGTAISLVEAHDFIWLGKISRFTGEPLKARVIDTLKPKHKAPKLVKKPKKKKAPANKKRTVKKSKSKR
ncbi:ATP-dependent RNA helicase SrmB [Agaribacter flavus]|uniref:ATP-dependent RNA helicase SrmB n=1 Tax=Agaribacter flavus TaxID=1902781 RepID=A0ABV7FMF7_9ALTE